MKQTGRKEEKEEGRDRDRKEERKERRRKLSNLAESTRASQRLALDYVALAFLHCAHVCDSEVDGREW